MGSLTIDTGLLTTMGHQTCFFILLLAVLGHLGSGLRVADKRSLVSHIIKKSEGNTENCNAYCKSPKGKFAIAHDCTRWCHCDHGVGHIKDCADCHQGDDCPNGKLFFDENLGYCEWPNKVARADCGAVPTTTPEPTTTTPKPTTTAEPTIGPTANPDDCKERCPPACADWAAKGHCTHEWVNGNAQWPASTQSVCHLILHQAQTQILVPAPTYVQNIEESMLSRGNALNGATVIME